MSDMKAVKAVYPDAEEEMITTDGTWFIACSRRIFTDSFPTIAEAWTNARQQLKPQSTPVVQPGVSAFFGTWPGDETDAELLAKLSEIREPGVQHELPPLGEPDALDGMKEITGHDLWIDRKRWLDYARSQTKLLKEALSARERAEMERDSWKTSAGTWKMFADLRSELIAKQEARIATLESSNVHGVRSPVPVSWATDEDAVKAIHPKAYARHWGGFRELEEGYVIHRHRAGAPIGHGSTEAEAWANARQLVNPSPLVVHAPAIEGENK